MGFNTAVILYNDQSNRWPQEIREAMQCWERHDLRRGFGLKETGYFGYGSVISTAHADTPQLAIIQRNHGSLLTSWSPVEEPSDLEYLAEVLRANGWKVKRPTVKME